MMSLIKLILIILIVLSAAVLARADEVYNFYFQKEPGAQTVPSVTVRPEPSEVAANVAAPSPASAPDKPGFRRWEFSLGPVLKADRQAIWEGGLFLTQYNISRYFALDAGILRATTSRTYAVGLPEGDNSDLDAYDFSAGITVTPIHVRVFGSDVITVSAVGGYMSTRQHGVWWDQSGRGERFQQARVWKPYIGPAVAINFNEQLGIYGQWRLQQDDTRYGYQSFGLTARF